ncbi:hypothetical protein DFH08DRAFT_822924 [Mycena albidolilacea]|uniref:Uncharacterized protein n=1 Tax=Mycena albidolilacea TaxID=1033008 RepID=A0AAD6Z7A3_9AGAR|nr:hypothetical protein DFH08DRAFT_822924 [Mycena albidolilacea]
MEIPSAKDSNFRLPSGKHLVVADLDREAEVILAPLYVGAPQRQLVVVADLDREIDEISYRHHGIPEALIEDIIQSRFRRRMPQTATYNEIATLASMKSSSNQPDANHAGSAQIVVRGVPNLLQERVKVWMVATQPYPVQYSSPVDEDVRLIRDEKWHGEERKHQGHDSLFPQDAPGCFFGALQRSETGTKHGGGNSLGGSFGASRAGGLHG